MIKYASIPKVQILPRHCIEKLLPMKEVIKAIEDSFWLMYEGKTIAPPKIYLDLSKHKGDFRAMPSYVNGTVGQKWVSVYRDNWKHNLPTVLATIILCDPDTGCTYAILDGTYITEIRTGATGAVAVKYLAQKDSSIIGIIGAGVQARTQLMAINEVLPKVKEVKVFDKRSDASMQFAEDMRNTIGSGVNINPVGTIEDATDVDVLVTTTPSTKAIIRRQYIKPGTHINAIGADAKGKQEIEVNLLKSTKIVVDDIEQACHSGEINVPFLQGLLKIEDIYGTLGDIVCRIKKGRENDQEVTVFDSTGLGIHDVICGKLAFEKAQATHLVTNYADIYN